MNADARGADQGNQLGERAHLDEISGQTIGCAFRVSNTLGCGSVEKVYENALAIQLREAGLRVEQQKPVAVRYGGALVGEFAADLFAEENVLVELKAVKALDDVHVAQCLNYLKATGLSLCLLLNFGKPKLEIRRVVRSLQQAIFRLSASIGG